MISHVWEWVRDTAAQEKALPPVLEVGSRNVNGTVRDHFPQGKGQYVGLDMREGQGVDLVADVVEDDWLAKVKPVNTVVCTETLEHVTDPWRAVEQMYEALAPGGLCLITVPFMFEQHAYPDDYWRFSCPGLRLLFERAGFEDIVVVPGGLPAASGLSHAFGRARRPR